MKEYSIGFRLNFDNIESEDILKMLSNYLSIFDRYEIKITNNIISSKKIHILLEVSEKLAYGKYSFHLPKDVLSNLQSFYETKKLIRILKCHNNAERIYLITHIPNSNFDEYLKYILNILNDLPKNYMLLLENERVNKNNFAYLNQINELCSLFHKQNFANIGICLDIGHLLSGSHMEEIEQNYCLYQLAKMNYILPIIKQIHIHDYFKTDHLQLGSGIMDLEGTIKFILKNDLIVPIIIETTVNNPEYDGLRQVLMVDHELKKLRR